MRLAEDMQKFVSACEVALIKHCCQEMMEKFIRENPALWNEDIGVEEGTPAGGRKNG